MVKQWIVQNIENTQGNDVAMVVESCRHDKQEIYQILPTNANVSMRDKYRAWS